MESLLGNIGTIVAILVSIGTLMYVVKNAKVQRGTNAIQATDDALKIAHGASLEVEEIRKKMRLLEVELESLRSLQRQSKSEIDDLKQLLDEERKEKESLKDWAERLVHQVISLGGEPVPFKPIKKKKE